MNVDRYSLRRTRSLPFRPILAGWMGICLLSTNFALASEREESRPGSAESSTKTTVRESSFVVALVNLNADPSRTSEDAGPDQTGHGARAELPETPRLVSRDIEEDRRDTTYLGANVGERGSRRAIESAVELIDDPIKRAQLIIADCRVRYRNEVQDYTCTFFKRERIEGRMTPQYAMSMKVRTQPKSVYIKIHKPDARAGREAIFVEGRNNNKALVHDVGWGKWIAGTLALDPRSARAMEDCRHPITEAGLGYMLDTVAERWAIEMKHGKTEVTIRTDVRVGNRPCTMLVCTHPEKAPGYMFHSACVFIDQELEVPLRFEAYDWPKRPDAAPELVEEYSFSNLKLNVGLTDRDFDPSNASYSFGRF